MAHVHIQKTPAVEAVKPTTKPAAGPGDPSPLAAGSLLEKVLATASQGRYEQALRLARGKGGQDLEVQNATGVCLMRTGQYDEAVQLYRRLVLNPGCTWMRRDRPVYYKVNFATALLLNGLTGGCLDMLGDLHGETTPMVAALRGAIRKWEKSLSWWAWIDWKLNRASSPTRPVTLDFPPGDFGRPLPAASELA